MLGQTEILTKEMNSLKDDLIAKHIQLKMKASGKWEQSLEVDVKRLRAIIYGEDYTEQLVNGREPGKRGASEKTKFNPEGLLFPPVDAIRQWILDKNIRFLGQIKLSTLAFLIARKIAENGTVAYQNGGTDLVEAVITPQRIQSILDQVSEFYIDSFTTEITGFIKKMAA
jgi:hypothetical protein